MSIGTALWNGVSGLNSFSTAMSVVSDNIANSGTTGFKTNSVHFGDMVNSYMALQSDNVAKQGAGSAVLGVSTDYAQGNLQDTSNWSDLAVNGEGFFVVKAVATDSGGNASTDSSQENYTRDGSFHLDQDGYLVNVQGYRVQGYAGTAGGSLSDIQITDPQQYASIRVDSDGNITAVKQDGTVDPNVAFTVGMAKFTNDNGLIRAGSNLYLAGPEIGNTYYNDPTDTSDTAPQFGDVSAFKLEGSNVDIASQMVNMIIYQSSYTANSKTITTSRDMLDTSINLAR